MSKNIRDSRLKQGLAIGVAGVVIALVVPPLVGETAAEKEAKVFLLSSPEVSSRLGEDLKVDSTFWRRLRFGWTPGMSVASYRLEVHGKTRAADATVDLRKIGEGHWEVYGATLWMSDGSVRLK